MSEFKDSKYLAYPEYKDSGIEWLRKIPSHWRAIPLKLIVDTRKGVAFKSSDFTSEGVRVVKASDIKRLTINSSEVYLPASYISVYPKAVLRKGEIILSTVGSNPDVKNSAVGQIGVVPEHLHGTLLNQNTVVFEPNKNIVHGMFLFKVIQMNGYRDHLDLNAHGTANQSSLSIADMLNFYISLPPKEEQTQIASFLDHETTKIDTLIEKQQQLIDLLKEKRQAVISHAVTKGIPNKEHPNVAMKDSGVECLGEVPEHWVVSKVKYLAELTPKKTEVENLKNTLCSFIPMEKLKKDTLVLDEIRQVSEVFDGYTYFKNEDLLVAKVTPCFENQNMVIARGLQNGIGFGSSEIYVLRSKLDCFNDFLYYRLQEDIFMDLATGEMTGAGGLKRVPSDFLSNFQFALPPVQERLEIVEYIKNYVTKFDKLMKYAESAIELMQERRKALISAAVTGKIDLRNWEQPND
ncbi:restriction endonuclease subunit S [Pseudoalteromonas undina]|uniref:restriction endonuclease subunit S n=1 Tax=Pseudoalteromonas undina TaxID=43660 RepID=UPI001866191C|nr:restriction endonuclease subunit S [Pseudoalteromonas undina]